jgi:hypothetical protein
MLGGGYELAANNQKGRPTLEQRRHIMNQKENREGEIKTESLTDLSVTDEQADRTKGGPESPGSRDGHWRESLFGNELMSGS